MRELCHAVDEYYPEEELHLWLQQLLLSYLKGGQHEASHEFYEMVFDGHDDSEFLHGDKALAVLEGIEDVTRYWIPGYRYDTCFKSPTDLRCMVDGLVILTMPHSVLKELCDVDQTRTARRF